MTRFRDISITKKLFLIMAVMAVLITTELVVLSYTIKVFSAVRSYVGGEGLWSKAQKNASYYLIKYSYTQNEKDYQAFVSHLAVPLSDHNARIALSTSPIDYKMASDGFKYGRIHPDDIDGVIWLFSNFHSVPYIHKAITYWTQADIMMQEFLDVGKQLHTDIISKTATADDIAEKVARIEKLNAELTIVEDEFSYTLGEGSRWLENVIFYLIIFTAVTVEFTGIFFTILTALEISRSINAMNKVAQKIANSDYSEHVKVSSKDEIGQLANSLNNMIDELDNSLKHRLKLEKRLLSILEGAPDAMVISDSSGKIKMLNAESEKLFGYQRSEIIGKPAEILIAERSRQSGEDYQSSSLFKPTTKTTRGGNELFGLKKDGSAFPIEVTVSPVETDEGVLTMAAVRDVTEKKNIEDMLVVKNIELVNSDLAKDQFMSHVSHELRTPLNGIITMTELLLTSTLTAEQREQLAIISESNEQLLSVINQVLDFSKVEAGNIGVEQIKINLHELIKNLTASYNVKSEAKNLKMHCVIQPDVPEFIISDLVKIRQILTNLLDNAVKFTNQGSIDIQVSSSARQDKNIEITFQVSDTGIGIPPEVMPKIFMPFSQGDSSMTRKYGGTGLGLVISKKLAEVMHGSIQVESNNSGTRFTFTVPVIIEPNSKSTNHNAHSYKTMTQPNKIPAKILLMEDNNLNQRTLKIILHQLGFIVDIANNGIEGLHALKTVQYDIILMDCQMSHLNGFQTAEAIRKLEKSTNCHIPIIGVTAHAMESHRQRCLDSGMDDYISKPIDIAHLNSLICQYLTQQPRHSTS